LPSEIKIGPFERRFSRVLSRRLDGSEIVAFRPGQERFLALLGMTNRVMAVASECPGNERLRIVHVAALSGAGARRHGSMTCARARPSKPAIVAARWRMCGEGSFCRAYGAFSENKIDGWATFSRRFRTGLCFLPPLRGSGQLKDNDVGLVPNHN